MEAIKVLVLGTVLTLISLAIAWPFLNPDQFWEFYNGVMTHGSN